MESSPPIGSERSPGLRRLADLSRPVLVVASLLLATAFPSPSGAAGEADPFYRGLLEQGLRWLDSGDAARAERSLELAAFGLLDTPELLTRARVAHAVARGENAGAAAFDEAFRSVLEADTVYGSYARLPNDALRERFETLAAEWIEEATLASQPAFAGILRRQRLERLEALPTEERLGELERLAAADPADATWSLSLAATAIDVGQGPRAVPVIDVLARRFPSDPRPLCWRERATLQAGECPNLESLSHCELPELPDEELLLTLDCLTAAGRWSEAGSVVVHLPETRRIERPFARRERRIVAQLGDETEVAPLARPTLPQAAPSGAVNEALTRPAAPDEASAVESPAHGSRETESPTLASAADLSRLRRQLDDAATHEALEQVEREALDLAARHTDDPEPQLLAGEAAYRAGAWQRAVDAFRRAGSAADRPEIGFYLAVALFESGDTEAAAKALARVLPRLERTDIVERYRAVILPR